MIDAIDHEIQNDGSRSTLALDERQIRLTLTTQSHSKLAVVATKALRKRLIFDKYLQHEEAEVSVLRSSVGAMGVLEEVRSQRKEGTQRRRLVFVWGLRGHEVEAEDFIRIRKVVRGKKCPNFRSRPVVAVSDMLPADWILRTVLQTAIWSRLALG